MISISNLTKTINGETLFSDVNFQINEGDKVGLVGPNGTGKTTLFRLIMGEESYDSGAISMPNNIRLAYFSQSAGDMRGRTVLQEVISGNAKVLELEKKINAITKKLEDSATVAISDEEMEKLLEDLGVYQTEFEILGGHDLESTAEEIITGLGIQPEFHHRPVEEFSGGQKMRIALAKVLLQRPDLILLDEPTNYLDLETIIWLEEWLKNFKGSIFMTGHDREFINSITKKIVEVSHQKITLYSGNFDYYERERDIRYQQQLASYNRQQDMLKKEEDFIARFQARASHAAQVQSRVKKLDKIDRVFLPKAEQTIDFEFPVPSRGGNEVVILKNLSKEWILPSGKSKKVFQGLSGVVNRLDRIAVIGVNGAGKSTLLKTICNLIEPTSGQVALGPSIKLGYFGQHTVDVLNLENTILEEVRAILPMAGDGQLRNLLAVFLFQGDDVHKKVKVLSGGEKARVVLATLLAAQNNFLVLDEPTNHLDMKSREVLLKALTKFEGTVMMVSHDRHFLHNLTSKVFAIKDGEIDQYEGTFKEYLAKTN